MAHFPILAMYGEMYGKSLPFAQRRFDSQSGACHAPRSGCGALGRPDTHPGPGSSALDGRTVARRCWCRGVVWGPFGLFWAI